MKAIKNVPLEVLSESECLNVNGGSPLLSGGNYVGGVLLPDTIDPDDTEAVLNYLAWLGSGPGGQGINP